MCELLAMVDEPFKDQNHQALAFEVDLRSHLTVIYRAKYVACGGELLLLAYPAVEQSLE